MPGIELWDSSSRFIVHKLCALVFGLWSLYQLHINKVTDVPDIQEGKRAWRPRDWSNSVVTRSDVSVPTDLETQTLPGTG